MTDLIHRFRGFGVALVVLALSAGATFAAAGSHASPVASTTPKTEQPSQGADEDQSEAPESEAPESPDPSESANADSSTAPQDTHGALVSAAAQMDTPAGFANHGAFVSCVAHLKDATLVGFDWTTVTPEACAAASSQTNTHADAGKAKGQAGRARGAAARAAAQAGH